MFLIVTYGTPKTTEKDVFNSIVYTVKALENPLT